jgi:hypothetical protein
LSQKPPKHLVNIDRQFFNLAASPFGASRLSREPRKDMSKSHHSRPRYSLGRG